MSEETGEAEAGGEAPATQGRRAIFRRSRLRRLGRRPEAGQPLAPPSSAEARSAGAKGARRGRGGRRRSLRGQILAAILWPGALLMAVLLALSITGWALSGRPVALPVFLVAEVQSRFNQALEGRVEASLGGIEVNFASPGMPELRLVDLRLSPPGQGGGAIRLPEVVARFDGWSLLSASVKPRSVQVIGAQIDLRRLKDGRFDLALDGVSEAPAESLAELLQRVESFFALPAFATLERIEAEAMTFRLEDLRAGQVWTMGDGRTSLTRQEGETVLDIGAGLVGGGTTAARAQITFRIPPGGQGLRIAAKVDTVAARDIAVQSPLLALLGLLDAPISGDLRADLDAAGAVQLFEGSLTVGQGALSPVPGARPLPLNRAEVAFGFDPVAARITASHLVIESPELRLRARAHVDLQGFAPGRIPEAFLAQVQMDEVLVDPRGMFAEPVRFSGGALDMRLRLDPFSVQLGQLSLVEEGRHVLARGEVAAGPAGWTVALDLELDKIEHDRLLALWPMGVVPRTREWIADNVQQGTLFGVKAGLRLRPGQEPRLSMGYEFEGADVRYLRTLPPIQQGRGYAMMEGQTYTTVVEDGVVLPPEGGEIRVTRSVFRVPDITQKPAPAEITLQTEGPITAVLSLLDQPPFGFLSKARMQPDLAEGRAQVQAVLRLPLMRHLKLEDVEFEVTGTLSDVQSDKLVKGRRLEAERLALHATPDRVEVSGRGRIGSAGFDGRWTLPIGKGRSGSQLRGTAVLDEGFAREFLSSLPAGSLTGRAEAAFEIALPRGEPPQLKASSTLAGAQLRIPQIGWVKPAASRGKLEVSGRLGQPPQFDRLLLEGNGLSAEGRLTLTADGQLERLSLSRATLGEWLNAKLELIGRGRGQPPQVRLTGGSLDIRRLPEGGIGGAGGGGAAGGGAATGPIEVALDRVIVSEALALTDLRGQLQARPTGLDGGFGARVNGGAPVQGQLVAGPRGMGIRLGAEDGGAVLASAKIFGKARGGRFDLALTPAGPRGIYTGSFSLGTFTVRDLPALAELLSAASIVGLLEQLSTSGVVFGEAQGQLTITPEGIEIRQGHAVGASFGVSLEGVYRTKQDWLDLQGVISPFYLINSIGAVLTRPGEGVMGFTYRIKGSAAAPVVSVNPLSVLAPSFFRDLLRRPAARLEGLPRQ